MSESPRETGSVTIVAGILTVVGGLLVLASIFVPTVTVAETTIDLYLWGGVVFAVGFAGGANLHLERGDTTRAIAQVVGAAGWLLVVVGGTTGPAAMFYVGLVLLLVGGALLYDVPGRIERWLD